MSSEEVVDMGFFGGRSSAVETDKEREQTLREQRSERGQRAQAESARLADRAHASGRSISDQKWHERNGGR